ncbi:TIM barrel protein [Candidatus Woesearchaeota archaeon]|nr:TIM barrel protein [Candidatus Woesearchaeota archaeon]
MKKLLFGTAGIPISTLNRTTLNGIKRVKELNLSAMELEFVRSINITKEKAPEVKKTAKKHNIVLTSHAPYFINLNAIEKHKLHASINRILNSAKITHLCGGYSTTFHAGFYLKQDPEKVYEKIKKQIQHIRKTMDEQGIDIWLRPETTGKQTQFSGLKDLLNISQETQGVMPCIDFAHMHARTAGKNNTTPEFQAMMNQVEKILGKEGLKNMHIHMSGIHYTEKGERHHLPLKESDMNYKDLLKVLKEFKIAGVVISESPIIEKDALLMNKYYNKI